MSEFQDFIELFPEIELPISLSSDTQRLIAKTQEPLNEKWVVQYLLEEGDWLDEFSEFMPCFRIPNTLNYVGLVYWEAGLFGNAFQLVTFSKTAKIVDRFVLAGTKYEQNELVTTVCQLRANHTISQIQGRVDAKTAKPLPRDNEAQALLKITDDGEVIEA
jgi:hypothetical protein